MNRLSSYALLAASLSLLACNRTQPPSGEEPGPGADGGDDPVVVVPPGPAQLKLSAWAEPEIASVGQQLLLKLQVQNTGQTRASTVAPLTPEQLGAGHLALMVAPSPAVLDVEPGATVSFTYVYEATDPGALELKVAVDGEDALTHEALSAGPLPVNVSVQGAALLEVDEVRVPATANVGAAFPVQVVITNGGQSVANEVTPVDVSFAGSAGAARLSGAVPASATLQPGASATFELTYRATSPGALVFSASAAGKDARSGAPLTSEPTRSLAVDVDTPAALSATLSVPAMSSTGQTVVATLVVKNTGSALARGVRPDPALPVVTTASGTASATSTSAPAPVDLPGGASAAFTFSYTVSGTGSFTLTGGAKGTDANSGAELTIAGVKSNVAQVLAPSALEVTEASLPATLNPGQSFTLTLKVRNNGGVAVLGVLPDPYPPTLNATDGASATTASAPAPQDVAPGATVTFSYAYTESGTGPGNLTFLAGARGVSAVGGATIAANPTESNLARVVGAAALAVTSVSLPAKLSRGQSFDVAVAVKNTGGSALTGVLPALTPTGSAGAAATVVTSPAAAPLAAGASATFTFSLKESGTAPGTLTVSAKATGTNPVGGGAVASAPVASLAAQVQAPAALAITTFTLPATLNRGAVVSLSMTVTNSGQAAAKSVLPVPLRPTVVATGGVAATSSSAPTAVTILGGTSQTFTWIFNENGASGGTLAFTGAASGQDVNSLTTVAAAARTTNASSVSAAMGCNGAAVYTGFGGRPLSATRVNVPAGNDRLRFKPYKALVTEYARVLGVTPSQISGQGATFDDPPAFWFVEPELSAVSLYRALTAAAQGCDAYLGSNAKYTVAPATDTAQVECKAFQTAFWSRIPSPAETTACVSFATSAENAGTPKARWAATCASVLVSLGFLTE